MRDQHPVSCLRTGDELLHLAHLSVAIFWMSKQIAERSRGLGIAKGKLGRFDTSAPRTREHALDRDPAVSEGCTDSLCVLSAAIRQVALRAAIFKSKAGWITDAWRCHRVPHQHDVPAFLQKRPKFLVGVRSGRRQRQQCAAKRRKAPLAILDSLRDGSIECPSGTEVAGVALIK